MSKTDQYQTQWGANLAVKTPYNTIYFYAMQKNDND